jgi:hypothetical protein
MRRWKKANGDDSLKRSSKENANREADLRAGAP